MCSCHPKKVQPVWARWALRVFPVVLQGVLGVPWRKCKVTALLGTGRSGRKWVQSHSTLCFYLGGKDSLTNKKKKVFESVSIYPNSSSHMGDLGLRTSSQPFSVSVWTDRPRARSLGYNSRALNRLKLWRQDNPRGSEHHLPVSEPAPCLSFLRLAVALSFSWQSVKLLWPFRHPQKGELKSKIFVEEKAWLNFPRPRHSSSSSWFYKAKPLPAQQREKAMEVPELLLPG